MFRPAGSIQRFQLSQVGTCWSVSCGSWRMLMKVSCRNGSQTSLCCNSTGYWICFIYVSPALNTRYSKSNKEFFREMHTLYLIERVSFLCVFFLFTLLFLNYLRISPSLLSQPSQVCIGIALTSCSWEPVNFMKSFREAWNWGKQRIQIQIYQHYKCNKPVSAWLETHLTAFFPRIKMRRAIFVNAEIHQRFPNS